MSETKFTPMGREALSWLVVNPDGKLLAVLDSESEAYWFTRNRGHANGSVFFKAPCDYASAPELFDALENLETIAALIHARNKAGSNIRMDDWLELNHANTVARQAIAKARGLAQQTLIPPMRGHWGNFAVRRTLGHSNVLTLGH